MPFASPPFLAIEQHRRNGDDHRGLLHNAPLYNVRTYPNANKGATSICINFYVAALLGETYSRSPAVVVLVFGVELCTDNWLLQQGSGNVVCRCTPSPMLRRVRRSFRTGITPSPLRPPLAWSLRQATGKQCNPYVLQTSGTQLSIHVMPFTPNTKCMATAMTLEIRRSHRARRWCGMRRSIPAPSSPSAAGIQSTKESPILGGQSSTCPPGTASWAWKIGGAPDIVRQNKPLQVPEQCMPGMLLCMQDRTRLPHSTKALHVVCAGRMSCCRGRGARWCGCRRASRCCRWRAGWTRAATSAASPQVQL